MLTKIAAHSISTGWEQLWYFIRYNLFTSITFFCGNEQPLVESVRVEHPWAWWLSSSCGYRWPRWNFCSRLTQPPSVLFHSPFLSDANKQQILTYFLICDAELVFISGPFIFEVLPYMKLYLLLEDHSASNTRKLNLPLDWVKRKKFWGNVKIGKCRKGEKQYRKDEKA